MRQCAALGLSPETDEFSYHPDSLHLQVRNLGLVVAIVALGIASAFLNPWLVLLGVLATFLMQVFLWPLLNHKTAEAAGRNIVAGVSRPWSEIIASKAASPVILLCAHYDTAPANPAWRTRLGRFDEPIFGLALLGIVVLVAYCLASGMLGLFASVAPAAAVWAQTTLIFWRSIGMWGVLAAGLPAVGLMSATLMTSSPGASRPENPGANDNGSGIAVVLAVAGELKQTLPPGWDVVIAFWGAEEVGLQGSYSFVEKYKRTLVPQQTVIINVDGAGCGRNLFVGSGQGILRRKAVEPALLAAWERACNQLSAPFTNEWLTVLTGTTDQAVWLDASYLRSLNVGRGELVPVSPPARLFYRLLAVPIGTHQTDVLLNIHSPADSLQNIQREALEETVRVVHSLILEI